MIRDRKELRKAWEEIKKIDENVSTQYIETDGADATLLVFLKWCACIFQRFYPDRDWVSKSYTVDSYGGYENVQYGHGVDMESLMMEEWNIFSSFFSEMLVYYQKSPFWDYSVDSLAMESDAYEEFQKLDDVERFFPVLAKGFRIVEFFEKEVFDSGKAYELGKFLTGCDFCDADYGVEAENIVLLRSKLLGYYMRYESKIKGHKKERELIKEAVSAITKWLAGCGTYIYGDGSTFKDAYFIMSDDSAYQAHTIVIDSFSFLLAGEVMDDTILYLNEIYHFLPDEILKKEDCSKCA